MIVKDPDDIKTILTSERSFEKSYHYRLYYKSGLFVDSGESYKEQRKVLSSSLQPSAFRQHIPIINREMDEIFRHFENKLSGHRVNAKDITARFSTRTMIQTVFGLQKSTKRSHIDTIRRDMEA